MLKDKRREEIYSLLLENGQVQTKELSELFHTSEMTIRRDLDDLCTRDEVIRTHGGALLSQESDSETTSEHAPSSTFEPMKEAIAKSALKFTSDAQTIYIDSGTTTSYIAKHLPKNSHNVVVSNNLRIVQEVALRPHVSALIIGGTLRPDRLSCYGTQTEEQIRQYKVDIAFLGASSVGEDGYFYDSYTPEAGVKKAIIQSARETYVLVDSSKFEKYSLIAYSHVADVTGLIVDSGISPKILEKFRGMGANIIVVP
ncbi:DeoR/GlpR family DNA-binding transcription regulator [Bariatricus massiliensis]|uniref:DeoR/GlpR family DNA-binding transcription regulator n=1 Tax=Bariatricus massiliensis TaxID=1745713 RepID=A0ABS8DEF3_9FIRM|nr:DeoR/GlpR family DNA-binding transcription regulator [Bariatricus massiliensis]MCB7302917.1 DeoR/GlpR family DNA-binding transcription regulator [Bariatricus massiliensis]MCB7374133.1 DeoR/GlpR family DNA-binding transcription regulator [Bariatricus massiliensis]MCB7386803.1 DeoR/GlpR family DNA-binding transcription regulator [Bariatricus massiliensis]MCB7410965.1 DeoR/GlpR family DNA-binding transcription regulator [Bariatricus massiliensis]MCQ5251791.1 DeoR/GlpR family DNA-binding transc